MTDHILKLEQQPNKFAPKTKPHGSRNWSNGSEPIQKSWHPFYEEKHHESPNHQHALSFRPSAAPYL